MKTTSTKMRLALNLVFLAIFTFGNIESSIAIDYYVSPSGNNANAGTTASIAFKTISKAVSVITAGSTVHVASGTYSETIYNTKSGTATARIRFVSTTKWGAKIVLPASSGKTGFDNRGAYVTIDGFEVDGQSATNCTVGINVAGTSDSVINCHVHHIYNTGIANGSGGAGILLDSWYGFNNMHAYNNLVHHVGPSTGGSSWYHGIYQTATGSIKNNITYANSGGGIHMGHDANHITVANNTSFGNGHGFLFGGGDYVNTTGPADYVTFSNNIAFDNTSIGFDQEGDYGTHNVWINNLSFQNGINWRLGTGTHSADVTADPQFVNYIRSGGGDYHLKSTSPAIDKGTATYAPSTDFDGTARPKGAGFDIGAYEYGSSACSATYAPNPASNLIATVNSTTQINLTWIDNSAVETAYIVERSIDGITFSQIASLPANTTSYSNTGLTANTKYYYRVLAENCFGNSTYSAIVNATTSISTGINEQTLINKISIYPNPFQTNFTIKISSEIIIKDAVMKVYDVCGKEVKTVSVNSYETIIDRDGLQSGIYFYQIINNNESIDKGKLLIQ
jgi:hypothetical protein